VFIGTSMEKIRPYWEKLVERFHQAEKALEPYHPEELLPMAIGLVMMFFGGTFMTTIACVEAFRIAGWTQMKENVGILYANYKEVSTAWRHDDKLDDNKDGIADINQLSKQDLIFRKAKLVLGAGNPDTFSKALTGIYAGVVAVVATLRVQFARIITLGTTIGDVISKPAIKFIHPLAAQMLPQETHKWIDITIGYICKSIGVSIAWSAQRVVSALHSAMRGSSMFSTGLTSWCTKRGLAKLTDGYWDEILTTVFAILGFYLQLSSWFTFPWLLYFPLFPLIFLERILTVLVAYV